MVPSSTDLPSISAWKWRFFQVYIHRYLKKNFHAVRLSKKSMKDFVDQPVVIFANHPSWWDPLASLYLANKLMPNRGHYTPMDGEMLERYSIFKGLGYFGLTHGNRQSARKFLKISHAVIESGGVLWMTPQGRFSDVRERPAAFMSGMAHLVKLPQVIRFQPLAIEYVYWNEKHAEVLLHFGEAVELAEAHELAENHARMEAALTKAQDELAVLAKQRSADQFENLLSGQAGMGGLYGRWMKWRGYQDDHMIDGKIEGSRS